MKVDKLLQFKDWQSRLFLAVCIFIIIIFCTLSAQAMEPPRPGELKRLKEEGQYLNSLEFAENIANHKVSPSLFNHFKQKMLSLQGKKAFAPPPGRRGMPTTGNVRTFALLIAFNDYPFSVTSATIDSMLYGGGDPADFPRESLTSYYDRSSYGLLDLSSGSTLGWYTTSYDRSAVTETWAGRENLIKEALNHYEALGHDFSKYDNDGDGDIDYFIVMWTGPAGAWATFWWGYQTSWVDGSYTLDGKRLRKYSWQWESGRPMVVIHETGHALGLPDYYDYDPDVGPDGGVGGFDMMHANRWDHNCFSKWMLDWLTPTVVSGSLKTLTLNPTATDQEAILIWPGVDTGDIFSEYYMVQNRQDVQNDTDDWLNVDGLAIWHLDATLNWAGTNFQYNNSYTPHKLLRLMEADGMEHIENNLGLDRNDFYSVGDAIGPDTVPSSDKYDGSDSCVRVWGITESGMDISASFEVDDTTGPEIYCPADITIECDESIDPANTGNATAVDNCDDSPIITYSDIVSPGACSQASTITRTWTAVDSCGNSTSCLQTIDVVDTTQPVISCNVPATITPPDAPLFFTPVGTDNCDEDPLVQIIDYECYSYTKNGKKIDKSSSCEVSIDGDSITIDDSGGVGDNIAWSTRVTDACGNFSDFVCEVEVVNPAK